MKTCDGALCDADAFLRAYLALSSLSSADALSPYSDAYGDPVFVFTLTTDSCERIIAFAPCDPLRYSISVDNVTLFSISAEGVDAAATMLCNDCIP